MTTTPPAPLLTYGIETTPHPLIPSPQTGEPHLARLRLVISNPTREPVRCDRITLVLPVGTIAADLAATGVGIVATATPHTWSVVAIQEDVLIALPQNGTAEFPASEHSQEDQPTPSLAIELTGVKVARKAGTARLRIVESSSSRPQEPVTDRVLLREITKVDLRRRRDSGSAGTDPTSAADTRADPGDGEVTSTANLAARLGTVSNPDPKPATLVPESTPVILTWEGPPGRHTLYSTPDPNGIAVTFPHATFPLLRDETFVVKTSADGLDRYDSLTVAVSTPLLDGGMRAGSVVGAPALTLDASSVTCTRTLEATALIQTEKTCTFDLAVTAADVRTTTLTSTGAVTATGPNPVLAADKLLVTGTLQSDATLDATSGKVQLLGTPIVTTNTNKVGATAPTDGFLSGAGGGVKIKLDSKGAKAYDAGIDIGGGSAGLPVHGGDRYDGEVVHPQNGTAQFVFYPLGNV
ncbi:hypothetical protein [Embleya sp. MST-111070]|uniref:hypothetical protein n=1 Tax=Embleya sp. MST-111070 TaxID=3398231 RepID=UPI003F73E446